MLPLFLRWLQRTPATAYALGPSTGYLHERSTGYLHKTTKRKEKKRKRKEKKKDNNPQERSVRWSVEEWYLFIIVILVLL